MFYRLLRLVNVTAKPFFVLYGKRHDLTINEWRVMIALANRPGLAVHELAEITGLDKMSTSRAVRRLMANDRVVRAIDPKDRRRALHRLTPSGAAVFEDIAPSARHRADELFAGLTQREIATLDRLIGKLEARAAHWPSEE